MAGLGFDNFFPRVIDSKTHAVIDYVHAATNFVAAAKFSKTDKRAAIAAAALGAAVLGNALMTDYELGVFRLYSFKVHGILDYGVAAASAIMPPMLGLDTKGEKYYYYGQGVAEFNTAGMTNYDDDSGSRGGVEWVGQKWNRQMRSRRVA
jgi:hypothetical protein